MADPEVRFVAHGKENETAGLRSLKPPSGTLEAEIKADGYLDCPLLVIKNLTMIDGSLR